jgi:hypothetical protein
LGFPDFSDMRSGAGAVVSGFGLGIGLLSLLMNKRYQMGIRNFKPIAVRPEPAEQSSGLLP